MTTTIEDRVTVLEGRVKKLETNPQPGQNKAFSDGLSELRDMLGEVREAQAEQQRTLDVHTGKLSKIDSHLISLGGTVRDLTAQVTGRVERLEGQLTGRVDRLEGQVTSISDNLTVIEVNLAEFKEEVTADVTGLKTDVTGLKTDMAEVKGALAEILDRLPPKAA